MLDVRDEGKITGEDRFREVARRLLAEGIERDFYPVKNYWNRTGRARSGFDERKNKTAPLATSKQGKKAKEENGKKRKRSTKQNNSTNGRLPRSFQESDDESDYSVHSEDEEEPPTRAVHAPRPFQPSLSDDERMAKASEQEWSWGTRKRQKTQY